MYSAVKCSVFQLIAEKIRISLLSLLLFGVFLDVATYNPREEVSVNIRRYVKYVQ